MDDDTHSVTAVASERIPLNIEEVCEQYRPLVCGLAKEVDTLMGGKCILDRDDFLQVGMLALIENAPHYDGRGSLTGFLKERVRWRMQDAIRDTGLTPRQGKNVQQPALVDIDAPIDPDGDGYSYEAILPDERQRKPDECCIRAEMWRAAMCALCPGERIAVLWYYVWHHRTPGRTDTEKGLRIADSSLTRYAVSARSKLRVVLAEWAVSF